MSKKKSTPPASANIADQISTLQEELWALYAEQRRYNESDEPCDMEEILARITAKDEEVRNAEERRMRDIWSRYNNDQANYDQLYKSQLNNPDLEFFISKTMQGEFLEMFKENARRKDKATKAGKASGVSRNRRRERMERVWLDIAAVAKANDPTMKQGDLVDLIIEDVRIGEAGYRNDIGDNPVFAKSTIAAVLRENLK